MRRNGVLTANHTNWVVNNVYTLPTSDLQHILLPVFHRVVDSMISTTVLDGDVELLLTTSCSYNLGAESWGIGQGWSYVGRLFTNLLPADMLLCLLLQQTL